MKPFLNELAEKLIHEHRDPGAVTLVFPNRRASLYFRKYLSSLIRRPVFAPQLLTIEDFLSNFSAHHVPDKLELVHRLYKCYQEVIPGDEPFDQFYFWGEMLLRDFDEVDKYMVQADLLFKDLRNLKELDAMYDYLSDEQRTFLKSFWDGFEDPLTVHKQKFLVLWNRLFEVYSKYRESLQSVGLAYDGMIQREVAENILQKGFSFPPVTDGKPPVWFVGFNALTECERTILSGFVAAGCGSVFWDIDSYYLDNPIQEAGTFFRAYREDSILSQTFPEQVTSNFGKDKRIDLYGMAQVTGQAKMMAQVVQQVLNNGGKPEEILIVLPDEQLMLPVLHSVGNLVDNINVTMGFPLTSTPVYNLLELLIELQLNARDDTFNHRHVTSIISHPYFVVADAATSHRKRKEIISENWTYVEGEWLRDGPPIYATVFTLCEPSSITGYLRTLVESIGSLKGIEPLDQEYAFHFLKLINRIGELNPIDGKDRKHSLKSMLRLLRQIARLNKLPFSGEPLKGLQVMGVLETRNLDFKHVFVLSMNEGSFPAQRSTGSYIPHSIRKAYGLSTHRHHDSMYAYLFYRVLQRAENIHLFYNSEPDDLGQGEMSRYLQQLLLESGRDIKRHVVHNPLEPRTLEAITVEKDQRVFDKLGHYCEGVREPKGLSPTGLNDYLECKLRFYFKYVAVIREADEVEEEFDSRMLGNFLHDYMEGFYKQIIDRNHGNPYIEASDIQNQQKQFDSLIDSVFIQHFGLSRSKPVVYSGQRLVVKEVVRRFAERITEIDLRYAPFTILGLERGNIRRVVRLSKHNNPGVVISGKIDRIDEKDGVVRVIDYKTGKDKINVKGGIDALFGEGMNKAAFQTILYAYLFEPELDGRSKSLVPGLMNRLNLFDNDFEFGLKFNSRLVENVIPVLPAFEQNLTELLEDLYDPAIPFDQTDDPERCRYCPYSGICYRA